MMEVRIMRIGTIVENIGAGFPTYFVYTGEKVHTARGGLRGVTCGYGITKYGNEWQLRKDCYAMSDLEDNNKFPRVGYIDLEQVLARSILKAVGVDE